MRKLNEFVYIKNESCIYICGKYNIPKDLPVGEYYIFGENVYYEYVREGYKFSYRNNFEGYAVFEKGDKLILESGTMTPIENIGYIHAKVKMLYPNHVYRSELEIPLGFYLFKYDEEYFSEEEVFLDRYECAIDLYDANSDSRRTRERGAFGSVEITSKKRHVIVLNGFAEYYGISKFDEIQIIENDSVTSNEFNSMGKILFLNKIIDLRLFLKYHKSSRFCGKVTMDMCEYEWYSINGKCKWRAKVRPYIAGRLQSVQMVFTTKNGDRFYKKFEKYNEIKHIFNREEGEGYILSTDMPSQFFGKEIIITLYSVNDINVEELLVDVCDLSLDKNQIEKYYATDFTRLEAVLKEFKNIKLKEELEFFKQAPEIIEKVIPTLEKIIASKNELPICLNDREIKFKIRTTYDKKFYCLAKLADSAKEVQSSLDENDYIVIFNSAQIEQIEIMYYLIFYNHMETNEEIRQFLEERSEKYFAIHEINKCISELQSNYGASSVYRSSVLGTIIKKNCALMQRKVDKLYSDIVKEKRVPTRWGNEYKLFSLISRHNLNTQYQYHCDWLGQQSLDIYIATDKIGIEYQGEQHYKPIDIWGGEEALKENQERDCRKKKLCQDNNVRLLEWSYQVPVNDDNVVRFMKENDITFVEKSANIEMGSEMAPIIVKDKERKKKKEKSKKIKNYIVQYDLNGNYVEKYLDIGSVAEKVGVSATSISKVLRGLRNSSAGYIWRKISAEETIPQFINVEFDISKINSGQAK